MGFEGGLVGMLPMGVVVVVWYLLRQKDAQQAEQIKLLFAKHDDDAAKLQALEVKIAREHYVKNELDVKFDRLENTFREGFKELGGKFDFLSDALIKHIAKEENGK